MQDDQKLQRGLDTIETVLGYRPDRSTFWRWTRPDRKPCLRSVMVGGHRMCSVADVRAFVAACTANKEPSPLKVSGRSPAKRQRDVQRASKSLERAGV